MAFPAAWPWLARLLKSLLGSALARILTGAGLAIGTYAAITPLVNSALAAISNMTSALPAAMGSILAMSGIGYAMSAIGSAMLTRVAIDAGRVFINSPGRR